MRSPWEGRALIGGVAAQGLERLEGEEGALLVAVAVFEGVVLVEDAAGG